MKLSQKLRGVAAGLAAAGLLVANSAWAHLITSVTSAGPFTFSGTAVLPGMLTGGIALAAGEKIVVTFSADCAVNAAAGDFTSFTEVDVQLLMGGVLVQTMAPTLAGAARFCSANGTAGIDGHARNSITVTGGGLGVAGVYQVRVIARTNGPGLIQAQYGDRSMVVTR